MTGGEFLSTCVHCGTALELRQPTVLWGLLVVIGAGVLALAVAIPLMNR
ncbi:MAG: hypothetical protein HYZ50_20615 [Deltaproteobacteria bacterium]|nr:hypothetical protein [Deltaproteobacteria bacterium]